MKARLMYKISHSQAPVALTEIIENSQQIHNLRNNEFKLYLPKPILNTKEKYWVLRCETLE